MSESALESGGSCVVSTFSSPAFRTSFPFPCRFCPFGCDFLLPVSGLLVSVIASSGTANPFPTCVAVGIGLCGVFIARGL